MLIIVALSGCNRKPVSTPATEPPISIERLDSYLLEGDNDSVPLSRGLEVYLAMMGMDTVPADIAVMNLRKNPVVTVFGPDVQQRLGALVATEAQLGEIAARTDELLPGVNIAQVYGIVSPYRQSVIVSDSIILLALNHYLGSDYPGYEGMPDYQRQLKVKERIPVDIAEASVRIAYPYAPTTGTLLERMLYEGAVTEAVGRLTGLSPYETLGLDNAQYALMADNESRLWQWLASNNLLYSTSPADISRLIDPAPATQGFTPPLPGRAGRFIGHNIIKSYLKNHDGTPLPYILKSEFYSNPQGVLIEAKYNPLKYF